MRSNDLDILMVPGLTGSGPDHWQTRWEQKLSTARRVEQIDWDRPLKSDWVTRIVEAVKAAKRPVVLVAHSLGALAVMHAAPHLPRGKVLGAFLVAPPDLDDPAVNLPVEGDFAPLPHKKAPFPVVLIASRNDHYCRWDRAAHLSTLWGAEFVDAGDAGHINTASGHGPWPEGLMRFAGFISGLSAPAAEG